MVNQISLPHTLVSPAPDGHIGKDPVIYTKLDNAPISHKNPKVLDKRSIGWVLTPAHQRLAATDRAKGQSSLSPLTIKESEHALIWTSLE